MVTGHIAQRVRCWFKGNLIFKPGGVGGGGGGGG